MNKFGEAIEAYTKGARDTIKLYGENTVVGITVYREPIQGILDKVILVLSGGSWDDLKKKYSYDQMFHLYAVVTLDTGRVIRIEKNANITLSPGGEGSGENMVVDIAGKQTTFGVMLEKTRMMMGDYKYFSYAPFENNCQNWLVSVMKANGWGDEALYRWIVQDITELSKELPGITQKIGDAITGLGSYVEHGIGKISDFLGFKKGGRVGRVVKGFHMGNNRKVIRRGRF